MITPAAEAPPCFVRHTQTIMYNHLRTSCLRNTQAHSLNEIQLRVHSCSEPKSHSHSRGHVVNVMYVLAEWERRQEPHAAPQLETPASNLERERGIRTGIGQNQSQKTTTVMQGPLLSLDCPSSADAVAAAECSLSLPLLKR